MSVQLMTWLIWGSGIVILAGCAILVWIYYNKPKQQQQTEQVVQLKEPPQNMSIPTKGDYSKLICFPSTPTPAVTVFLFDSIYGRFPVETELPGHMVDEILQTWHSLGRIIDWNGSKHYAINLYRNSGEAIERYKPVDAYLDRSRSHPPEDVAAAFDVDWVKQLFSVMPTASSLGKIIPILVFMGIAMFILLVALGYI